MLHLLSSLFWISSALAAQVGVIEYSNIGYNRTYYSPINGFDESSCACTPSVFDITESNGPYNEELAVRLKGSLSLSKFAFYTAEEYVPGTTTGQWIRESHYDSEQGLADNVTFLAFGDADNCFGEALKFLSPNGTAQSGNSTTLRNVTLDAGDQAFIYSGERCADSSSASGDCWLYRNGTEAYHGFGGEVKAFLFEFVVPDNDSTGAAISLYNARSPRSTFTSCNISVGFHEDSGGNVDIFAEDPVTAGQFDSMIDSGVWSRSEAFGDYFQGAVGTPLRGGILFSSNNTATIFLSNLTSFDETISNSDLQRWLNAANSSEGEADLDARVSSSTAAAGTLDVSKWLGLSSVLYVILAGVL